MKPSMQPIIIKKKKGHGHAHPHGKPHPRRRVHEQPEAGKQHGDRAALAQEHADGEEANCKREHAGVEVPLEGVDAGLGDPVPQRQREPKRGAGPRRRV